MSKLIDIKAELAVAQDNVNTYYHIKNSFIQVMQRYPNTSSEFVVNSLCEDNDMKREEFDFICNTERQMFEDFISSQKRTKK